MSVESVKYQSFIMYQSDYEVELESYFTGDDGCATTRTYTVVDTSSKLGGPVVIAGEKMIIALSSMVAGKHYIDVTCTLSNGLSDITYFVITFT